MTVSVVKAAFVSAAFLLGIATGAHATSTYAHAMVVSGQAEHIGGSPFACATSGPQAMEQKYFGSATVGLPLEGYGYCGLSGGIQDTSNPSGASVANESVSNAFNFGVHNQTAAATADFGVLKAKSSGSYSGAYEGGSSYHAGEAAAYSTDTLPTPADAAFVQFGLSIDGAATITGNSQTLSILDYQIDNGPIYNAFVADLVGDYNSVAGLNGANSGPVAGFTVMPGSLSGGGTVTSFRSDVSGATFDLTLALLTSSFPNYGGLADNDFSETARLSSLSFFDANGQPIAFGTIVGASGRLYDADGVHTAPTGGVPEPATWAMVLIGFGAVGAVARRRARCGPPGARARPPSARFPFDATDHALESGSRARIASLRGRITMPKMNSHSAIGLCPLAALAAASVAFAQPASAPSGPKFIRGAVTSVAADQLVVKARDGKSFAITLAKGWTVQVTKAITAADIKPGSFIGTAEMPQADGTGRSLEVHVFPPGVKMGEGHYNWDLKRGSMMTNGTVGKVKDRRQGTRTRRQLPQRRAPHHGAEQRHYRPDRPRDPRAAQAGRQGVRGRAPHPGRPRLQRRRHGRERRVAADVGCWSGEGVIAQRRGGIAVARCYRDGVEQDAPVHVCTKIYEARVPSQQTSPSVTLRRRGAHDRALLGGSSAPVQTPVVLIPTDFVVTGQLVLQRVVRMGRDVGDDLGV